MERAFIIDKFNTFDDWRLILTGKSVDPPEPKTNYVNIDGMSGSLDLSESLTGEITYNDRNISASFIMTEGTLNERSKLIHDITNTLHGKKVKIIEPDDPTHYFLGRVTVTSINNRLSYSDISIEAVCDPWRYSINDCYRRVEVNGRGAEFVINNNGVKTLSPEIVVEGAVVIRFNNSSATLGTGNYKISDLKLRTGVNIIDVSGYGAVTFKYKEADL